jgi:hypothetical protein
MQSLADHEPLVIFRPRGLGGSLPTLGSSFERT